MIAVTGATGQLGRHVINALLRKVPATEIIAVVRNVDKAKDLAAHGICVRHGDYDSPTSWNAALLGVDKLLLISSSEVGQRTRQHQTVITAAKRAGVKLLAYTSLLHADTSVLGLAVEHRETEAALKASGVPHTLLRNSWYTENYAQAIPAALASSALYGCANDGRIASASRVDYAEAAAAVLTGDDQAGKVYELAGDTAYTLSEFAAEIARQTGQTLPYVNLTEADYKQGLEDAGLPELVAQLVANSDAGASKGALYDDSHQLSTLIGRPTSPWQIAIQQVLN